MVVELLYFARTAYTVRSAQRRAELPLEPEAPEPNPWPYNPLTVTLTLTLTLTLTTDPEPLTLQAEPLALTLTTRHRTGDQANHGHRRRRRRRRRRRPHARPRRAPSPPRRAGGRLPWQPGLGDVRRQPGPSAHVHSRQLHGAAPHVDSVSRGRCDGVPTSAAPTADRRRGEWYVTLSVVHSTLYVLCRQGRPQPLTPASAPAPALC